MIKYNKKYDKPVKFRFVVLDDEYNVIEVLYETKEYDSKWDSI